MTGIYPTSLRIDYGRCEGIITVGNQKPEFSWALEGSGCDQVACRVEVTCGEKTVWDSGWILSSEQRLTYAGEPLCSGTLYSVAVSVRGEDGVESRRKDWCFRTGLFEKWSAPWIAPVEDFGDAAIYFETDFELQGRVPVSCVIYVCGIGYQRVRLNGLEIAEDECLSPAVSSYHKRCYYTVHGGLEEILNSDVNHIEITVAQGWRRNLGKYIEYINEKRAIDFFGQPQLTAMIDIEFADGSMMRIQTDDRWVCRKGPITFAHIFDGEIYDARLEKKDLPQEKCRIVPAPGEDVKMCPQELEPIRIQAVFPPVSVHEAGGGYIFDLGQNIAGICEIHLPPGTPEGVEICLKHSEVLDEDGDLYTAPLRGARAEDRYITGVSSNQPIKWRPVFTYHGFRYVKVTGLNFVPDRHFLTGLQLYTAIDNASSFRCGSALANQIQHMVLMTERDNLHSIATDCPQRDERMAWLNDSTVRFEELPYNFDGGRLFRKIARDICDAQQDGAISCTAPYIFGGRPADPVCSSFLIAAQMSWLHYGDKSLLCEVYPALSAWNDYLTRNSKDGIVTYSYYGDWAGPQDCCHNESATSAITPGEFMSTGYYYMNSCLLASFARILGKEQDVRRHEERAELTRKAMLKKWLSEDGKVCTGSQACQAFALRLGILPEDKRTAAASQMHRAVVEAGTRLTTGNLCTLYLMEMLTEYGYIDTAWELLMREEYPSWGYMVQNGATTIWERFELKKDPGMNSHCHPMYGAVGKWLYSHIAGITPVAPGFSVVRIRPYIPQKLMMAQATVETCKGDIYVRWQKSYGETRLYVKIPCGVRAEIETDSIRTTVKGGTHYFIL